MKIKIGNWILSLQTIKQQEIELKIAVKRELNMRARRARKANQNKALNKIKIALNEMQLHGDRYTEYALQKKSGVSINTIKKYRENIEKYMEKIGMPIQKKLELD